jgi:hypothetical protein
VGGRQSRSGYLREEKNLLLLMGTEPRFLDYLSRIPASIPTDLGCQTDSIHLVVPVSRILAVHDSSLHFIQPQCSSPS